MRGQLGICLTWLVGLGACGGGDKKPDKPAEVPLAELGPRITTLFCDKLFTCCSATERAAAGGGNLIVPSDAAECATLYGSFVELFFVGQLQSSADAGRSVYHADVAASCLDLAEQESCSELTSLGSDGFIPPACDGLLEPRVPAGGACAQSYECLSGDCVGASGGGPGQPVQLGACGPERPTSGACLAGSCERGYFCDSSDQCVPERAEGESCTLDEECVSGYCDSATTPPSCQPPPPLCDGQ